MSKKILWMMVSGLMALSLVIAACGPAVTPTTESAPTSPTAPTAPTAPTTPTAPAAKPTQKEVVENKNMVIDSLGRQVEKPIYGGTFTRSSATSPQGWDEAFLPSWTTWGNSLTQELLLQGDWKNGPTGSGKFAFQLNHFADPEKMAGNVAESWELVDDQTMIFHIRKGMRFGLRSSSPASALVAGRELTADDVVYSLTRIIRTPSSYYYTNYPWDTHFESITAPDKSTVIIKTKPSMVSRVYTTAAAQSGFIIPREVIDKYGNEQDWRNNVGTGPFMVTDYVPDSLITYVRNPNYWEKDPLHPDNTLPYLDSVKILIIPDRSTQDAAFRTGKLDQMDNRLLLDKNQMLKTNPQVRFSKFLPQNWIISWRVDKKPFDDLKVRQALWMAVDKEAIIKDYFQGDAVLLAHVAAPIPDIIKYYTPLDQLPPETRQLWEYHPDRAQQLLKEAGYPTGFKTEVAATTAQVDYLSIIKDYWAKIGVDLSIRILDNTAFTGVASGKTYTQMITWGHNPGRPEQIDFMVKGQAFNYSMVDDPLLAQAFLDIADTLMLDMPKNVKVVRQAVQHILAQAYAFQPPQAYTYVLWQPWLKNYTGEVISGSRGDTNRFPKYSWIDQALKKSMGY